MKISCECAGVFTEMSVGACMCIQYVSVCLCVYFVTVFREKFLGWSRVGGLKKQTNM